jgi:hypothetical protein
MTGASRIAQICNRAAARFVILAGQDSMTRRGMRIA